MTEKLNTLAQNICPWLSKRKLRIVEAVSLLPIVFLIGLGIYGFSQPTVSATPSRENTTLFFTLVFLWIPASMVPVLSVSSLMIFRYLCDELVISQNRIGLIGIYFFGVSIIIISHVSVGVNTSVGGQIFIAGLIILIFSSFTLCFQILYRLYRRL